MARVTKLSVTRKKEILAKSRELFIELGFDKTQISTIASGLNISQGLVYHYFESKRDILYEVLEEISYEQQLKVREILWNRSSTAYERLSLFMSKSIPIDNYGKLMPSLHKDQGIIEHMRKTFMTKAAEQFELLIEEGNKDGSWECKSPKITAEFLMAGCCGVLQSSPFLWAEWTAEDREAVASIIMNALGAKYKISKEQNQKLEQLANEMQNQ